MKTQYVSVALAGLLWTCICAAEPVQFADPDLKQVVISTLHIDHDPTPEEMLDLTQLVAHKANIQDLHGLEYALNLTSLSAGVNEIADMSPLAGLTGLTSLNLERNRVTDLSGLSTMTNLTELHLPRNLITDISLLSGLHGLRVLVLHGNQISDISALGGLTQLTVLDLSGNPISVFSPLVTLTNLEKLWLADDPISDLSVLAGMTQMRDLNLWRARFTDDQLAVLSGMPNMIRLQLQGNGIQDTSFLGEMTQLEELRLEENRISDISPLAGMAGLTKVTLSDNAIADISPLGGLTHLAELDLLANPLDAEAYGVYINQIRQNNPGLRFLYDVPNWVYTLTVIRGQGGIVTVPGEGRFHYLQDTTVALEAAPASDDYEFIGWTGSAVSLGKVADPLALQTTVTVDANCWVQARFIAVNESWQTVYFSDFEEQTGPEWSTDVTDVTPAGERRFLGQFGNDIVALTLADLPPHASVRLSFDLFILRSWDGDGGPVPAEFMRGNGPDIWSVAIGNGPRLLRTTFDNRSLHPGASYYRQSYPAQYPSEGFFPQTGATETNTLGYLWTYQRGVGTKPSDAVYCLSFTFPHTDSMLTVLFSASGLSALHDESWGLDTVRVELPDWAPESPVEFHDAELRACVGAQLGVVAPMPSDMLRLTSLTCSGGSISDLTGLESAVHLIHLDLSDNTIADISPLRDLRELVLLDLTANPLNSDAHTVYLPELQANNPDAAIRYDPPRIAWSPDPANGATNAVPQVLRWTAGETAVAHDVYFGAGTPLGEQDLLGRYTAAECPCPAGLAPAATYYWRVDEVEADYTTIHAGDIWSFTTLEGQ